MVTASGVLIEMQAGGRETLPYLITTIDTRPDLLTRNELTMSLRFLPDMSTTSSSRARINPGDRLVEFGRTVTYAQRLFRKMVRKMSTRR